MPQNCVRPRVPILAKPTGATCNLACSYCFFLDKELLYPDGKFRMTEETLESYIRQLIAAHRSSEVTVAWQGGDQVSPRSVRPEQFGRFLIQVFDECIPNGDLYSCNHFVEPDYLLGNIHKNNLLALAGPEEQFGFGQRKYTGLPQFCLQCPVLFACHGECPKNRFGRTPDGKPGLNYLCAGYGAFFQRVEEPLQILAMLIRAGRPASDVMKIWQPERMN